MPMQLTTIAIYRGAMRSLCNRKWSKVIIIKVEMGYVTLMVSNTKICEQGLAATPLAFLTQPLDPRSRPVPWDGRLIPQGIG